MLWFLKQKTAPFTEIPSSCRACAVDFTTSYSPSLRGVWKQAMQSIGKAGSFILRLHGVEDSRVSVGIGTER